MNCIECGVEFERTKKSVRVTCSKACSTKLAWKKDRDKRVASIGAARRTPEQRALSVETNHQRWAKPGEREKLSARNRKQWAENETYRATMRRFRENYWTSDRRRGFAEFRKRQWAGDAAYRIATVAGIQRDKRSPEKRALFSALLRARWRDPKWREMWISSLRLRMSDPAERAKFSIIAKRRWMKLKSVGRRGWGLSLKKPIDYRSAFYAVKMAEQPLPETNRITWAMMRKLVELEGLGTFDGTQIDAVNAKRVKRGEAPVVLA